MIRGSLPLPARVGGAALALAVSCIHVKDQGGLTSLKDPAYLGQGYRVLGVAGVVAAVLLLLRPRTSSWLLAAAVAVGPLVGFLLTRTVGLPKARHDIGNWSEPLGLWSIAVEASLLVLCTVAISRGRPAKAPHDRSPASSMLATPP